jgi:hypothetical protein
MITAPRMNGLSRIAVMEPTRSGATALRDLEHFAQASAEPADSGVLICPLLNIDLLTFNLRLEGLCPLRWHVIQSVERA